MAKKEEGLFDKVKQDMLMEVVDGIMPKLKPFIAPAMVKMEEYLGEDEKIIVIRKLPGQKTKVFILDKTKGEFEISNGKMTADPEVVIGYHDIGEFVEKMISGEMTTQHEEQKQIGSGDLKRLE